MPIYQILDVSTYGKLGIWKIEESVLELTELCKKQNIDTSHTPETKSETRLKQWLSVRLLFSHFFDSFSIVYDQRGKPFIDKNYHISISHSNQFAAVIINESSPCGIDIEKLSSKVERIKHKFLSTCELSEVSDSNKKMMIYWCAKEVMYKIYGKKELIFDTDIAITNFNEKKEKFSGEIKTSDVYMQTELIHKNIEDFILVYSI